MLFRIANPDDIRPIITLLHDDIIAQDREHINQDQYTHYEQAFLRIIGEKTTDIYVIEDTNGTLVGVAQLFILPHISRMGATRAQVESVRISKHLRGQGIGAKFMLYLMDVARANGCVLMQLTTDNRRDDAHRFYKRLGFQSTHNGMKIKLA